MQYPMQDLSRPGDGHHVIPVEDETTKDLVRDLVAESKHLFEQEVRLMRLELQGITDEGRRRLDHDVALAKAEMKDDGRAAARAGGAIGLGGVLAHAALYLALFGGAFALSIVVPLWLASLIVAAVAGVAGALFLTTGVKRFKRVQLVPRRTVQQLQEDSQWMRERSRALRSTVRANA